MMGHRQQSAQQEGEAKDDKLTIDNLWKILAKEKSFAHEATAQAKPEAAKSNSQSRNPALMRQ